MLYSMLTYIGVGFTLSVLEIFRQCEGLEDVERQLSGPRFFLCPFMNYELGSKRAMVETELGYSFVIKINNLK